MSIEPTRTAALERLHRFLPEAGRAYAGRRNYDLGPVLGPDLGTGQHRHVSGLSPYMRHRILTEAEVLEAVLNVHSRASAEKFIQEVYWRTYWKGWLEMRPSVWISYQAELRRALDRIQSEAGLRADWEAACTGDTGIACFDAWAQELTTTGYLHNHARMWFASIWIFTLRLPWTLGADFFLRHLLDGDPASNTLSWRWVGGLQTVGKHYLARASNISKYTEGRFCPPPGVLNTQAAPLEGPPLPPRMDLPAPQSFDASRPTGLLLHEDDLSPGWLFEAGLRPVATATLAARDTQTPLAMAPGVLAFRNGALADMAARWSDRLGPLTEGLQDAADIAAWARQVGAVQIVTPYAPVGPVAACLSELRDVPVLRPLRACDLAAWPFAKAGFFKFKARIPQLLDQLDRRKAA